MVDIIILKVLLSVVFIVVVGCIFAVSQLSNETKILIMTKSEKILRLSITKFDWSNDDKHTQMIPYDDALKAVEEALAEEPNWEVSNLTDISKWDLSNVNNHAVKEDATIKAKPKSRSKTIGFSEWIQMVDVNKYLNAEDFDCSKFFESFKS